MSFRGLLWSMFAMAFVLPVRMRIGQFFEEFRGFGSRFLGVSDDFLWWSDEEIRDESIENVS